ncbi:PadR family transcriptional regulator [Methanospirillum stamsii]|nr:PadR family transcriptional regulator [Methanospirillum stamsii]
MKNIWKFAPEDGKERGLLTLLVLHLLEKKPQSGYELLKEISETTDNTWVPNKGTLYPLLKSLEQEGLIQVKEIGKRSKITFELTEEGRMMHHTLKEKKDEAETRVTFFKKLHREIFGEEKFTFINFMMDIRFYVEDLPPEKQQKAIEILQKSFDEIKKI